MARSKRAIVSAHKFGGPKGVGALLLEDNIPCSPLIVGGGQKWVEDPGRKYCRRGRYGGRCCGSVG